MATLVSDVLRRGGAVDVDLLTEPPTSSDPSTWKVADWQGYRQSQAVPQLSWTTEGTVGQLTALFEIVPGSIDAVVGFAVTYQGATLLLGVAVRPVPLVSGAAYFRISFVCQPWVRPT